VRVGKGIRRHVFRLTLYEGDPCQDSLILVTGATQRAGAHFA
jgi:hypothetical protein